MEEMGQTTGIHRVLETSTVKQLTGGGEIAGADVYKGEVQGEIRFKMPTLMNQAPHIEPDAAFKRRVQVFPFRATFDESNHPGCVALAMERKNAPAILRQYPDKLSALLREERPGILFKWIQAAKRFIDQGEHLRNPPTAVREATDAMFHEADLPGRLCEERLEFGTGPEFCVSTEELRIAGEALQRESGLPGTFSLEKLFGLLKAKGCKQSDQVIRNGARKRGWRGVRLADMAGVRTGPIHVKISK